MKKHSLIIISLFISLFFGGTSVLLAVDKANVDDILKAVFEQHVTAMEKENNQGVIATFHSESPALMHVNQMMQQMFPIYDVKHEILDFRYIGIDEEYALVRVKQKNTKTSGPKFQDHITDTIYIFREEGKGNWKLWQAAPIDMKFL